MKIDIQFNPENATIDDDAFIEYIIRPHKQAQWMMIDWRLLV